MVYNMETGVLEDVRVCPLRGDANNCEECVYFPYYEYNPDTGRCEEGR